MRSRREFLKDVAVGTAGVAASWDARSYARVVGANDRVNFAIAGLHGRGVAHLECLRGVPNCEVTAICDVDRREFPKFASAAEKIFGRAPRQEQDIRKLLESKDVDAITVATPEHWHTPMALMALAAGKHVYLEKPSSHNPREGEILLEAQKKHGKLVQLGDQQRSSTHTIEAMARIKAGLIGRPYFAKAWYSNSRKGIGVGKPTPVPEGLDWDLWQGPAPRRPYKDNIHPYNWHWFWHWGTGETLNNGSHEVDLARWALGVGYPSRVNASGGRYHFRDDWEFYDTLVTNFEYDDVLITWECVCCQGKQYYGRGRGVTIHGTEGTVLLDRDGYEVYDLNDKRIAEVKANQKGGTTQDLLSIDSMTTAHFANFVNGIREGEALNQPIANGHISNTILLLSNIAWKYKRTLRLDTTNGRILGDPEAMTLWRREYEKGWEPRV
jgi:predicted dehydrogenase